MPNRSFDPTELVALARKEYPDQHWLHTELEHCRSCISKPNEKAMVYFVDPAHANEPGAEWQHEECITLESHPDGMIVIDVLKNKKIGAVEYVWKIEK